MHLRVIGLVLVGLLGGIAAAFLLIPETMQRFLPAKQTITVGKATVGGPFTLTDHTGKRVTEQDFRGKHMLVFFGFTFCPDVCPTGLQVMTQAMEQLGPKAERIQPIFISVDPERDTPEQLAMYVSSFHPSLVGLTGTTEEVEAAARAYRVYYRKVKDEKSSADYTVDHTSIIYLMDPKGEFVTHFTHATPAATMAERLAKAL